MLVTLATILNKLLIIYFEASGVISGTQTAENGQIEWSRTLPSHCQLSYGLKQLVTPLLAGLLEVLSLYLPKLSSSVFKYIFLFVGKSTTYVVI